MIIKKKVKRAFLSLRCSLIFRYAHNIVHQSLTICTLSLANPKNVSVGVTWLFLDNFAPVVFFIRSLLASCNSLKLPQTQKLLFGQMFVCIVNEYTNCNVEKTYIKKRSIDMIIDWQLKVELKIRKNCWWDMMEVEIWRVGIDVIVYEK